LRKGEREREGMKRIIAEVDNAEEIKPQGTFTKNKKKETLPTAELPFCIIIFSFFSSFPPCFSSQISQGGGGGWPGIYIQNSQAGSHVSPIGK